MSSKIKLAFFVEILVEDFDGASRTIFNIVRRIPKEKFEVLFICGVPPKGPFDFPYIVIPIVGTPFNKDYTMAVPQFVFFQLSRQLRQFNPDIVHISTPSLLGKFALKFAKNRNIPVTTIYHTHFISYIDYYLEKTPFLVTPVKKWIAKDQKGFYEKCDIAYIPTKNMVNDLSQMGISSKNFKIWPRGLESGRFTPEKKNKAKIRKLTGNDNSNIIFASRLVWEKNLKTLVKIYENAKRQKLPLNFIIAGDGMASESLMKMMPEALFLGHVHHEELSSIYASCDVFVFTSISETYGNVVAEAMASGLPCVIANGGGSAHFVENGKNGFLCSPEDSLEYLEKIKLILTNEELRTSFIQEGLEFVAGLQWEQLTDIYFSDLHALVDAKKENYFIPLGMDYSF